MTNPTPWKVIRERDSQGFRAVSIADASGLFVANIVMQVADNEAEIAARIVRCVNAECKQRELLDARD